MKLSSMIVLSNYVNDPRVKREAETLVENGYKVIIYGYRDGTGNKLRKHKNFLIRFILITLLFDTNEFSPF